jgi:glycosyltransferase involved in cell wall biosynthesis
MTRFLGTICYLRFGYLSEDPRLQKQVAAALDEGWQVHVVCLKEDRRSSLESHERLVVHRLGLTRWRTGKATYILQYTRFILGALAHVARSGRRSRLTVVQANNVPNLLTLAAFPAKLRGARVVLDMQEPMPELFVDRFGREPGGTLGAVLRVEERVGTRIADEVITVSEVVRDLVEPRCRAKRPLVVVENTPDERFFEWVGEPSTKSPFLVSCHSSLLPRYGVDVLVEAFRGLRHLRDVRLEIYGDGEERPALERLARRHALDDVVTFHGQYPLYELARDLGRMHVGVVPLVRTPFTELMSPNKLFEYVALGKPVIASRLRGMQAYFDDHAVRFVEPGNPHAIASAIEELYGNAALRASLAREARRRLELVRWGVVRQRYLTVLRDGLSRHR